MVEEILFVGEVAFLGCHVVKLAYTLVHVTGLFITVGCCAGLRLLPGLCDSFGGCDRKIHITLPTMWTSMRNASEEDVVTRSVVQEKRSDAKRAFDITSYGQMVLSEQASCEKILHESIIDPQKIEESGTDSKSKCALEDCSERSGKRGCHLWCGWISWPHDER